MTTTTRRTMLAASASLGAGLAASPLLAQTTSPRPAMTDTSRQAPGFYRFKVGEAEITVLNDGFVARRAEGMVRNVALPEVETALRSSFIDPNALENPYNFAVVRTGGKTYVIDAGFADNGPATTGQAAANMRAAGIDPDAIDAVIVSHFHPDHINGIRRKDGTLTYGKAEIHVPEAEWAFWMDDARMAQAPQAQRNAFNLSRRVFAPIAGQVRRFSGEREVVPGIIAVPTPGHTPGHVSFIVASGSAKVLIQGDVSGNPWLFVQNPGWHSSFDMDAQMAEATRRRVYDMAAVERMPIIGYHFPFPAVGYVAKDGNGYRFGLAQWRSVV
jgi:glyoxylase-like metal-dependent hydrolase (beta-lactamase superfamily II)